MSRIDRYPQLRRRHLTGIAALVLAAPIIAGCAHATNAGPSAETPAPNAAAPSATVFPQCVARVITLYEMQNVVSAGGNALATLQAEDITTATYIQNDGGPKNVQLIEFTGSDGPPPEIDPKLKQVKDETVRFARALGIPHENLDLGGEAGIQAGNAGEPTLQPAGSVLLLPLHAVRDCNQLVYPHGSKS